MVHLFLLPLPVVERRRLDRVVADQADLLDAERALDAEPTGQIAGVVVDQRDLPHHAGDGAGALVAAHRAAKKHATGLVALALRRVRRWHHGMHELEDGDVPGPLLAALQVVHLDPGGELLVRGVGLLVHREARPDAVAHALDDDRGDHVRVGHLRQGLQLLAPGRPRVGGAGDWLGVVFMGALVLFLLVLVRVLLVVRKVSHLRGSGVGRRRPGAPGVLQLRDGPAKVGVGLGGLALGRREELLPVLSEAALADELVAVVAPGAGGDLRRQHRHGEADRAVDGDDGLLRLDAHRQVGGGPEGERVLDLRRLLRPDVELERLRLVRVVVVGRQGQAEVLQVVLVLAVDGLLPLRRVERVHDVGLVLAERDAHELPRLPHVVELRLPVDLPDDVHLRRGVVPHLEDSLHHLLSRH
mmetsp:Transcript_15561/g.34102  ORF Transcript_15561/g.34102 Transcript_15561/m.34102 type:complete len:414 (+) Transcript_15561:362-1603(+)